MKTDISLYSFFQSHPDFALRLLGLDTGIYKGYTFSTLEVKDQRFISDALFTTPLKDLLVFLYEFQFNKDPHIYLRIIQTCAIYLRQATEARDIMMAILFREKSLDPGAGIWQPLIDAGRIKVLYLDELSADGLDTEQTLLLKVLQSASENRPETHYRATAQILQQAYANQNIDRREYLTLREIFLYLLSQRFKTQNIQHIKDIVDIKDWDPTEALWIRQLLEQNEHKRDIEIARNMILKGFDEVLISQLTSLTISEIQQLRINK